MLIKTELNQLEDWLDILLSTYRMTPSNGLAKVIQYYFDRVLSHQDIKLIRNQRCHYLMMKKYWSWQMETNGDIVY